MSSSRGLRYSVDEDVRDSMDAYFTLQQLSDGEKALIRKVQQNLSLMADLCRSDVFLCSIPPDGGSAVVIGEAKPTTVPPIRGDSLLGAELARSSDPVIYRCLERDKPVQGVTTVSTRGAPIVQSAWPIRSEQRVVGVLAVHTSFLEYERQRRKSAVYRNAVSQVRQMVIDGRLEGAESIRSLGEHDGSLVVDAGGEILYISSIAENLYRKLGYMQSLLHGRIEELRSDESVFYKALETGGCVEEIVQEGEYTLVKRAIPLVTVAGRGSRFNLNWLPKLRQAPLEIDGAIIVIEDITEERQKEQELKIKSTMIQEIHHRVKNNLQTIAALLRLQARRTGSPETADILQQTIHRILSIAVVHEYLSYDESSIVDLHEVAQRIVNEVTQGILDPMKRIRFTLEGEKAQLPAQQATSCALIINELLQNAVEHGFANKNEGTVSISLLDLGNEYRLEIADNGEGLRPGFDPAHDGSLGLQIVRTLVKEDLRGQFEMIERDGVRSIISFPKSNLNGRVQRLAAESDRLVPVSPSVKREEEKRDGAAD